MLRAKARWIKPIRRSENISHKEPVSYTHLDVYKRQTLERECKYIDDYHTQIGSDVFHICEFAELCERNGHTVEPAGKEKIKPAKSKEKER